MCITHNVAELVDYRTFKSLVTELIIACRLFQDKSAITPSPNKWGISSLLDRPKEFTLGYSLEKNVSFEVPVITKPIIDNYNKNETKLSTAETVLFLLEHILLFECKPLKVSELVTLLEKHDEGIENRKKQEESRKELGGLVAYQRNKAKSEIMHQRYSRKLDQSFMLEEFESFTSKNKLLLCAECKTSKNSWLGRDNVSLESLPDDVVEREHYISLHVAAQSEAKEKRENVKPVVFFFECYESSDLPNSCVLLNFRTFQKTNFNPILGIFLKEYLPKLMKKINLGC